jgi:hypothetical protein
LVHVFVIKSAKENGLKKKKNWEIEMKHAWKRKETVEHVNCNWNLELHVSLQPLSFCYFLLIRRGASISPYFSLVFTL